MRTGNARATVAAAIQTVDVPVVIVEWQLCLLMIIDVVESLSQIRTRYLATRAACIVAVELLVERLLLLLLLLLLIVMNLLL